jgi:hypothetical protein
MRGARDFAGPGILAALAFAAAGCGGSSFTGSRGMGTPGGGAGSSTTLLSVSPAGHAVGVSVTSPLVARFNHALAPAMTQFVDLHVGDPSGPTVPTSCVLSGDGVSVVCSPDEPLEEDTQYAFHLGGGMLDAGDHLVDMAEYGLQMGGQWLFSNMMRAHGGMPWSMMGGAWHGSNGGYGMFFTFTTA